MKRHDESNRGLRRYEQLDAHAIRAFSDVEEIVIWRNVDFQRQLTFTSTYIWFVSYYIDFRKAASKLISQ